jgi:hypothetical protein
MVADCKDRNILKARLRADLKVYADSIALLQQESMAALVALHEDSKEGFEKAHRLAEHARLAYKSARRKLDQHIAAHDCE